MNFFAMDPIPMLDSDDEIDEPPYWLIDRNPLFLAVLEDDLETLKNLLGSDKSSMNVVNSKGLSLLNWVIHQKRVDIFDYLLSLEQTDINYVDSVYGTPLICLATRNFDENFALKLIEKGADIHKTNNYGETFLHVAARYRDINNLAIGKLIIEKGIDINHQASIASSFDDTPLHVACLYGNVEWIHMLLYYGADAIIYNSDDELPLNLLLITNPDKELVGDILFNYTFDVGDSVPLNVVFDAMCDHSPTFCKMLDYKLNLIIYNEEDLEYMADKLYDANSENFKQFLEKFKFVVEELCENFPVLDILIENIRSYFNYAKRNKVNEIIETILKSTFGKEFVQSSTDDSVISVIVKFYSENELTRVTEIVCLMLSYGLRVTSADLDAVYDRYGFCELFKILLHMDIEKNIFWKFNNQKHSLAAIFYQPQMTIENILERVILHPRLLFYFNNPKLKEYLTEACEDGERREVEEKIKQLPHVPCLVELSRNASRQYIIERFDVKNCRQFYTVIQSLPISRIHEEIISLERMLY